VLHTGGRFRLRLKSMVGTVVGPDGVLVGDRSSCDTYAVPAVGGTKAAASSAVGRVINTGLMLVRLGNRTGSVGAGAQTELAASSAAWCAVLLHESRTTNGRGRVGRW